jgi:hypothetical protein
MKAIEPKARVSYSTALPLSLLLSRYSTEFDPVFILKRHFRQNLNSPETCTLEELCTYWHYEGHIYFKGTGLMEEAKLIFKVYIRPVYFLKIGTGVVSVSDELHDINSAGSRR